MSKSHKREQERAKPLGEVVERVTHIQPPPWAQALRQLPSEKRQAWLRNIFDGTIHGDQRGKQPNLLTTSRSELLEHIVTSHSDLLPVPYEAQQAYLCGMNLNELREKYFLPSFHQYAQRGVKKTGSGMQLKNQDEKDRMLTARLLTLRYMEELGVMDAAVCAQLWKAAQRICGLDGAKSSASRVNLVTYFRKCQETFLPFDTEIPPEAVRSLRKEAQGEQPTERRSAARMRKYNHSQGRRDTEESVETVRAGSRAGLMAALALLGAFSYGAYRFLDPSGANGLNDTSVEGVKDLNLADREQCLAEFNRLLRRIDALLANQSLRSNAEALAALNGIRREMQGWIELLGTLYRKDKELFENKQPFLAADWGRVVPIIVGYERRYLPQKPKASSKPSPTPRLSSFTDSPRTRQSTPYPAPKVAVRQEILVALGNRQRPYLARKSLTSKLQRA